MQVAEGIEVFKYRFHHLIHHLFRHGSGGYKRCTYTKGFHIIPVTTVHATRDSCGAIIGMLFDQAADHISGYSHQFTITGGGRFFDRTTRVTY